jgi:acetolactate synthase-1/2/3 large subunit
LPYLGEVAADRLKDFKYIVTIGAKAPVSFFAYPGKPSKLWPEGCNICELAGQQQDQIAALEALVDYLNLPDVSNIEDSTLPELPENSALTADAVGIVVANLLPENAIISDESITSGVSSYGYYDGAAHHDLLTLTGGAIGQGLPVAVGAAVACPDRKVISLQADGSAMYTNQSLWTMVRENLDVCVVIFNNSSYAILNLELARVGVENPGERASSMLDISRPNIEWTKIAAGMGMAATKATTIEEFMAQFKVAMGTKGPRLIEVLLT